MVSAFITLTIAVLLSVVSAQINVDQNNLVKICLRHCLGAYVKLTEVGLFCDDDKYSKITKCAITDEALDDAPYESDEVEFCNRSRAQNHIMLTEARSQLCREDSIETLADGRTIRNRNVIRETYGNKPVEAMLQNLEQTGFWRYGTFKDPSMLFTYKKP